MSGEYFCDTGKGTSAQEVFDMLVKEAQYDHGHSGYTGTIAEKSSFLMVKVPKKFLTCPDVYVERVMYGDEPDAKKIMDDKWGPAGCVDCGDGVYIFFGCASS